MGVTRIPSGGAPQSPAAVETELRNAGLAPRSWSNPPGHVYDSHEHEYHKRLVCVAGSITFHTPDGDVALVAGDRLELEPHTPHSASVGPDGVTCVEAPVR